MISREFPHIDNAINLESWEWLQDNIPELADAISKEVHSGATPQEIKRHVNRTTGRYALAARCEQAAAYLGAEYGAD